MAKRKPPKQTVAGLRKAIRNPKTPKQFLGSLKKRLAAMTKGAK